MTHNNSISGTRSLLLIIALLFLAFATFSYAASKDWSSGGSGGSWSTGDTTWTNAGGGKTVYSNDYNGDGDINDANEVLSNSCSSCDSGSDIDGAPSGCGPGYKNVFGDCVKISSPPTLSLTAEVNDGPDYNANTTIRVAPNDKIDVTWNSNSASSCADNTFGASGLDGTLPFNPNAIVPGTPKLFRMRCTGAGGSVTRTITAQVPTLVISLTADRELVRYGETVTYSWTIALASPLSGGGTTPYPMNCVMSGGANRTFDASVEPTGTITSVALTNSRQTTLTCTEVVAGTGYTATDSTIVEIIPRSEEI